MIKRTYFFSGELYSNGARFDGVIPISTIFPEQKLAWNSAKAKVAQLLKVAADDVHIKVFNRV